MKHFTFDNFSRSASAKKHKIDNTLPANYQPRAEELVDKILDPLYDAWGSIVMSSGYRSPALNSAINGAKNSAHMSGYAADIQPANGKIDEFKSFVINWLDTNNIPFDQFIDEVDERSSWVHIAIRNDRGKQRGQFLKYRDKKYSAIRNPKLYKPDGGGSYNATSGAGDAGGGTPGGDVIAKNAKLLTSKAVIEKEKQAIEYLSQNGMSVYSAAALCAIFTYECGFNPNVYNKLEYSGKGVAGTSGWNCGEGLIGWTYAAKYKMKLIKDAGWDKDYGISTNVSEYLKDSAKHIYTIPFEGQLKGLPAWYKMCGKMSALANAQDYKTAISVVYSCVAGCKANWDACVACGDKYVKTHTEQARAAGRNTVYYNGFLLRAETCRRILNRYQPGLGGDDPVSGGTGGGGGYGQDGGASAGSGYSGRNNGPDHVQYPPIDARAISTGGSTQMGTTEGRLTGKSVYLNKDMDIQAIQENDVYDKDESGQPILDENGNPVTNDLYLLDGANENVSDSIEDISELPADEVNIDLSSVSSEKEEYVKGVAFNVDGSYVVKQSKTTAEIIALVQEWWNTIQTLKGIDFKNIAESLKSQAKKEWDEAGEEQISINAMVYMKAAFDMYGHAYREGMTCPVCGKKARFLPPGGYCSVECLLKAAKDKSLAFLMAPNDKYAWMQEIVEQLCAVLDLTNLLINSITLIPDIIRELASLPDEWKDYVKNKIAEGFVELQELIQKAMVKKNELLEKLLKPINFGIIAKPVAMAMSAINTIRESLQVAQEAFNMAFDTVKLILDNLSTAANMPPGLVLPAEEFAWALTPRSYISPQPYTNPDAGKIFVTLPGGSGVPINGIKPLLPSALQNINMEAIDTLIQSLFPPITPVDYYLEPELFEIRYLFSDQSDLVFQIRQQLEDLLTGGPDYIPKFENLLPIKMFTFQGIDIPLPNLGYVWFLLGLFDAWGPHSKAMVGSILNPAL